MTWQRTQTIGTLVLVAAITAACGGQRVLVPPRVDLAPYGQVGLVTFTVENARGSLHEVATRRFAARIFEGQFGIEVLELGEIPHIIDAAGEGERPGVRTARLIGDEYGVPAVFFGHLTVSDVTPSAGVANLRFPFVEATVSLEGTVRLLSTESGGTLWSTSSKVTEKVGEVGMVDGKPYFAAENPDEAYGRLLDVLMDYLTEDLRPTWQRR